MTFFADLINDLTGKVKKKGHGKPTLVTDGGTYDLFYDEQGLISGITVYDDDGNQVAFHTNLSARKHE